MPQDLKNRWRRGLFGTCHDPDATARRVEMESSKLPVSVAFSCCSRPRPRRRQSQSSHVRSQSRLGAPGTLGRRQSAIGIYFTLETGQEHGTRCLGRFFGVALGVEAVGSQAGAKGSLCRGQPPSVMHCNPSLPVATPPVAFRQPRTATRTQTRGAGFSYRWTRDERSGAEPWRDGALIDSQHFSQQHSQQCSQTRSRNGLLVRRSRREGSAPPAAHRITHSNTHRNTHRPRSRPCVSGRARSERRTGRVSFPSSLTVRRTATIAFGVLWVKTHVDPRRRYGSQV